MIGIDDWAWRRNHRYGTIVCDLERRRPVSLLPDREPATAEAWLRQNPQIQIVARDRGGAYGLAAARALLDAVQVADRWHLMENASRAFLDAVRKSMRQIRKTLGATRVDPKLLTAAERLQYEGYLRREQTNAAIMALSKDGMTIKEIVRRTGHSRGLVRQVLRGQRNDVFRSRESSLEPYLEWLDVQWAAGKRNGSELWRRLRTQGFRGSRRVVSEWATRRKRGSGGDRLTMVQCANRRADHQAQAGKTPNVRTRKARSSSSPADRCDMKVNAPNLRQSQNWMPIRGEFWTPIDKEQAGDQHAFVTRCCRRHLKFSRSKGRRRSCSARSDAVRASTLHRSNVDGITRERPRRSPSEL